MYKHFLPSSTASVLVVGDVILDRYVYGDTNRISPEAPVPIVKVDTIEERPGGAANVALNINALGLKVQLMGITGTDDSAKSLSVQLSERKVKCQFVSQASFPTVTKLRILSQNQQLLRLDYEATPTTESSKAVYELYKQEIINVDVVVLSDYAKGSLGSVQDFISLARENNTVIMVDPKGDNFSRYYQANILTPNLNEFIRVVGACDTEDELLEKGQQLCHSLSLDALVLTRGGNGMTLIERQTGKVLHLKAQAHEVFDVTGAGDTVIATLSAALASEYDLEQALEFSNLAAGLVVEKLGTAVVTAEELNKARSSGITVSAGVVSQDKIVELIEDARMRGQKIVMTNGCFDILHPGHVNLLEQAKLLGDCLIVAVNDDESVKLLKGDDRPVNSINQRMSVLAGLSSVDWVIEFSDVTPEKLIQMLKPDVLVKGGDYDSEKIVGAEFVQSNGGEVVSIPFQDNHSTSQIIQSIKETNR